MSSEDFAALIERRLIPYREAKVAAMRAEDFDAAKRHKQLLGAGRAATAGLSTIEAEKQAAVAAEEYHAAADAKRRLDAL